MKNIYLQILDLQQANSPLVLATVTGVEGSTPQKPGSSALFGPQGLISGTVGGGVVEGEVEGIALKAIHSKESGYYRFNLDHDISHETEAICGGQISILVDANPDNHLIVFKQIKQSLTDRIPGVLVSEVSFTKNNGVYVHRYWYTQNGKLLVPGGHREKLEPELKSLLSTGKSGGFREVEIDLTAEEKKIRFFLEPVFPPAHLVIAGAGHIGKALAHLAKLLDFEVTVMDDRTEYANPINIPDADHIIVKDIGLAMLELKKTDGTYIVIVTRGHKDDASALKQCIGSDAAYIGMIGSKNKVALMHRSFIQKGWSTREQWKKIHAPVGLDIQSQTIQEIAVSIAAQLVLIRNSKKKC